MDNCARKIKGIITYPCCSQEKIVVYEDTGGWTSNKCPNCGKYAMFDFEHMTAWKISAVRGVTQNRQKNNKRID